MPTTTPENASDLYKSQITEIALPSPVDKTAAKALIPQDGVKIYPQGPDGGLFIGGTNVVGYYDDDGTNGSYGTRFKPTGGDGSVGWERPFSGDIDAYWFKCLQDGTTDDTAAYQVCVTVASNLQRRHFIDAKTRITGTITVPANGYYHPVGRTKSSKENITSTKLSVLYFDPSVDTALIDLGDNCHLNTDRIVFQSSDDTQQWDCIKFGILGNYTSQTSANGKTTLTNTSFWRWGGTVVQLGGEVYGNVNNCMFHYCAQALAINGRGEITFNDNTFESIANASFTAGTGNKDAYIYIFSTTTKWNNSVTSYNEQFRPLMLKEGISTLTVDGSKVETGLGVTSLLYDTYKIDTTGSLGAIQAVNFTNNSISGSSLTGDFVGRFITMVDPGGDILTMKFDGNAFAYGPGVLTTVPIIDVTACPTLRATDLGNNWKENSLIPLIQVADGTVTSPTNFLAGMRGSSIEFITISRTNTLSASATDARFPLLAEGFAFYYELCLNQILPVSMTVSVAGTLDATNAVTFKYVRDASNSDVITIPAGGGTKNKQIKFDMRAQYLTVPNQSLPLSGSIVYTTQSTVVTSINVTVAFTYAMTGIDTSQNGKGLIDIV